MSHERDAIARAFSRPFIEPPKRATAKRVGLKRAGIALLAAGGRKTLTTKIRKGTQMKPTILIGAIALTIGAMAWHNNIMSLADIIGSKPVGLQCQMNDETSYYGKNTFGSSPTTRQHTWVIELNGSKWHIVTMDGQPMKEMVAQLAKENGRQLENGMMNVPLRVTAEAYVLMEPEEKHDGDYNSKNTGLYIDRLSGAMNGESWLGEKSGDFGTHLTTTGKCSPIDIKANL